MLDSDVFAVPGRGCEVMPVFSSGQSARQAPETFRAMRIDGPDLCLPAAEFWRIPAGPAAGVRSLHQAWEAAMLGVPLAEYADDAPGIAQSRARKVCGVTAP
jgi:ribulose-bisphosphate carboxylase large chain